MTESTTTNALDEIKAELARATVDGKCPNPECQNGTIKPKDMYNEIHWCMICDGKGTTPRIHDIIDRLACGYDIQCPFGGSKHTHENDDGSAAECTGFDIPPDHRLLEALVADALGLEVEFGDDEIWRYCASKSEIDADDPHEFQTSHWKPILAYTTCANDCEAVLDALPDDINLRRYRQEGFQYWCISGPTHFAPFHPSRLVAVCCQFLEWYYGQKEKTNE